MGIGTLLFWIAVISCSSQLIRGFRLPNKEFIKGWLLISGAILTATLLVASISIELGGVIGGGLWVVFFLLPTIAGRRIITLSGRGRYRVAKRLANFARILHPFDGWWRWPVALEAQALAQEGKLADARMRLDNLINEDSTQGRIALVQILKAEQDWEGIVAIYKSLSPQQVAADPGVTVLVRALAELGKLDQAIATYLALESNIRDPYVRAGTLLILAAFSGRPDLVEQLSTIYPNILGVETEIFWLETAKLLSGDNSAIDPLKSLSLSEDMIVRNSAIRRLQFPLPLPNLHSHSVTAFLLRLEEYISELRTYGGRGSDGRPIVVYALTALNVIYFLFEAYLGGTTDEKTLIQMGAVVPLFVLKYGEWWRIFTGQFLHAGFLHIMMNMLALTSAGPFVEATFGKLKFTVAYLIAGTGAMLSVLVIASLGLSDPETIVVGASGGIMGIIGMTAAILLYGYRQKQARLAKARLKVITQVILFQVIVDTFTPQISSTAHLGGVLVGFLVGWVIEISRSKSAPGEGRA